MNEEEITYYEDDLICIECIEDNLLGKIIESGGHKEECALCGETNFVITIKGLAKILDPIIRENYEHGEFRRHYEIESDDYWDEQEGEDLAFILYDILGQELDCQDTLIEALESLYAYNHHSDEYYFYDSTVSYKEIPLSIGHLYDEWDSINNELKKHRRFFSDRAKIFFDMLFEDLENLKFYGSDGIIFKLEDVRKSVVQEWPVGFLIYRGRRADSKEKCKHILSAPLTELAPPPSMHARAGRMNPEGISFFYGALDEKTCLAEMRSSIGENIIIGSFKTSKALRILDFTKLDRSYLEDGKGLSYFQIDFKEQAAILKFRSQIHKLISQPIVRGHEDDYLITQVLAEYLAHVRNPCFDGILFGSTQKEGGINVVLFPKEHSDSDDILNNFNLKYVDNSYELYLTQKIEYDTPKLTFSMENGDLYIYKDY